MKPRRAAAARFMEHVQEIDGHLVWTGCTLPNGYGQFRDDDQSVVYVHRWAYTQLVGPIPHGMEIDHLCRVRTCCDPAHMEPVTPLENKLRVTQPERRGLIAAALAAMCSQPSPQLA